MNDNPTPIIPAEKPLDEKRKNALFRYIGIMFAVAFLFVLISMLGELRSSEATISALNQSSTSAIQKAEQLQDHNRQLETDNAYLTGRIEELEKQLADLEADLNRQQAEAMELQSQNAQQSKDIADLTQELLQSQEETAATQAAYELLLQAQQEEGSNAGTMSGLKQYVQYFAENAKNLYENLTKEGE